MPAAPDRPIDLLVIRLSSFGDIVLAEPVVRALKSRYPRSHMSFAVLPEYAGLPALFTSVDSVLVYSKQDGSCGPLTGGSTFDIVIDLQANRHSRRLTAGLKAGMLLRYRRPRLGRFFTVYLPWLWRGSQPAAGSQTPAEGRQTLPLGRDQDHGQHKGQIAELL